MEAAGARLLTDPVLRPRVKHLRRIVPAPELDGLDHPDAVLISHAHFDHLDVPSLQRLRACPVLAPRGCGRLLRSAGMKDVTEVRPGERVQLGGFEVTAARMDHDGRRHPFSRARESLAYVIDREGRALFAGDTGLFDGMRELAGGIDVALLPIWGWGPRLGRGHMGPAEAARAAAMLEPRVAVPIHWGTYASRRAPWLDDPERPDPAVRSRRPLPRAPAVEVRIVPPGGATEVRGRAAGAS